MQKATKKFKITLILIILAFTYTLKEEILIGGAYLYSIIDKSDSHRIMGELYSEQSYKASKNAAYHFQIALGGYKYQLPDTAKEHRGIIEFIIGTHYECGRGVDRDIMEAKKWYQKSVDSGFVGGEIVLDRLRTTLQKVKSKADKQKKNNKKK